MVRQRKCLVCAVPITNRLNTEPDRLYTDKNGFGVYLCGKKRCGTVYENDAEGVYDAP